MSVAEVHDGLLGDLAGPGDWWDGRQRRAIMDEARRATTCAVCAADDPHAATDQLPAAAVDVVHRVVRHPGRLTREWAHARIAELGDGQYAEVLAVVAIVTALDVYTRSIGIEAYELLPPVDGPPMRERPTDVGDVGAWIPMTEEKQLANVTRALSLVPRTNATWRTFVTESYSRGPEMLDLTWQRELTRPQIELIASRISSLQECFY